LPIGTNAIILTVTDDKGGIGQGEVTIVILPPLTLAINASPTNSSGPPLTVQFSGQATGGTPAPLPYDTTDDHLGTVTAAGENNGINGNFEVATNAFDNTGAKWLDFANANPTTRASWLQYKYANGLQRVVTNYTKTSANDSPERDPSNWALLGSNDGGTNWTTLDTQSNQAFTDRFQQRSFPISSPAAFNIYRLRIDRVSDPPSAVAVQLSEIQLLGTQKYTYAWSFGDGAKVYSESIGSPDLQQHTYSNNGAYTVVLTAMYGPYKGTNSIRINIGPALSATMNATPTNGSAPLAVQFTAQANGGRSDPTAMDTTDDRLGTVTAQGENAGINGFSEVASNAFDNTVTTKWLDFATNFPSTRQSWIQYQYANNQRYLVTRYSVTSANDSTIYPDRNPANWRFLGSTNNGQSWVTLDTRLNQVFTNNFQKLTCNFSNASTYNIYRFQIDRVADPQAAVAVQLAELEFMFVPPAYSYLWLFGDGASSSAQNPVHNYASNGVYLVTLVVSDGLTSVTNSLTVTVASPTLSISQASQSQVTINWPGWASAYSLYLATNLAPPITWSLVTNQATTSSNQFILTLPIDQNLNRFFRLSSP